MRRRGPTPRTQAATIGTLVLNLGLVTCGFGADPRPDVLLVILERLRELGYMN